jgi:hypothetical protein
MTISFIFRNESLKALVAPLKQPTLRNASREVALILNKIDLYVTEELSLTETADNYEMILEIDNSMRIGCGENDASLPDFVESMLRNRQSKVSPELISVNPI